MIANPDTMAEQRSSGFGESLSVGGGGIPDRLVGARIPKFEAQRQNVNAILVPPCPFALLAFAVMSPAHADNKKVRRLAPGSRCHVPRVAAIDSALACAKMIRDAKMLRHEFAMSWRSKANITAALGEVTGREHPSSGRM